MLLAVRVSKTSITAPYASCLCRWRRKHVADVEVGVASSADMVARADDVVRGAEAGASLLSRTSQSQSLQYQLDAIGASSSANAQKTVNVR